LIRLLINQPSCHEYLGKGLLRMTAGVHLKVVREVRKLYGVFCDFNADWQTGGIMAKEQGYSLFLYGCECERERYPG